MLSRARALLWCAALVPLLSAACSQDTREEGDGGGAVEQATFETPEGAVAAFAAAVESEFEGDVEGGDDGEGTNHELMRILGPGGEDLIESGDEVADREAGSRFLERFREKHRVETTGPDSAVLYVGELDWPFPLPLVRGEDGWLFDTEAGREEILDRRVGSNELAAIEVCLAYVDAQRTYARTDWDGDGLLEYAQRIRSTPGKRDGLYWESEPEDEESPLGPLFARAEGEGYDLAGEEEETRPYHGYFYRVLKGQGPQAPSGAFDYTVRDSMLGGFALVAYPASYGVSGVMSFLVNHTGVVLEKDLGEETESTAKAMELFDPDDGWAPSTP